MKRPMVWGFFLLLILFGCYTFFGKNSQKNHRYILDNYIDCTATVSGVTEFVEEHKNSCNVYMRRVTVRVKPFQKSSTTPVYDNYSFEYFLATLPKEQLSFVLPGTTLTLQGTLTSFQEPTNPGQFDEKRYQYEKNIYYKLYAKEILNVSKNKYAIRCILYSLKSKLRTVYETTMPSEHAGVMTAMLLGDKSLLDIDVKKMYQANGIGHLLAISGLHVSMLSIGVYNLCRLLKCKRPLPFIITVIFLFGYQCMTGFGISTSRAVIMMIMVLFAKEIGRSYDLPTGISLSAVIILVQKPYAITSCSFLLSYTSILGILFLAPMLKELMFGNKKAQMSAIRRKHRYEKELSCNHPQLFLLYKIYKKLVKITLDNLCTSFSITLATLPIMLSFYYEFATYSILLNALILPFSGILLGCGLLGGFAGIVCLPLGTVFLFPSECILGFYEKVCVCFEKLPKSILVLGCPSFCQIAVYYLILAGSIIFWKITHTRQRIFQDIIKPFFKITYWNKIQQKMALLEMPAIRKWVYMFLWGSAIVLISYQKPPKQLNFIMLDVGQGDGMLLRTPTGHTILMDGGSSDVSGVGTYRILRCLKYYGIDTIDYMIMTHADSDHISGQLELMRTSKSEGISIQRFLLPNPDRTLKNENYFEIVTAARNAKIPVQYIQKGDILKLGDITLECLHPKEHFLADSTNGYSTTLLLTYGICSMLLTGDIEGNGEEAVIQLLEHRKRQGYTTDIDILKVAHHGSKYSTCDKFLDLTKPEIALISAGKNNSYGHPHKELLARLKKRHIKTVSTIEAGAVCLACDGQKWMSVWKK